MTLFPLHYPLATAVLASPSTSTAQDNVFQGALIPTKVLVAEEACTTAKDMVHRGQSTTRGIMS